MKLRSSVLVVSLLLGVSACASAPEQTATTLSITDSRFQCYRYPSALYRAGVILRTPPRPTPTDPNEDAPISQPVSIDDLVVAVPEPTQRIADGKGFTNIVRLIDDRGWSGDVALQHFSALGVSADLNASSTYNMTMTLKDNKHYVVDDATMFDMILDFYFLDRLVKGSNYYFIKEAIGSREIEYTVTHETGVAAQIGIRATEFGGSASTGVNLQSIESSGGEFFSCIYMESIDSIIGEDFIQTAQRTPSPVPRTRSMTEAPPPPEQEILVTPARQDAYQDVGAIARGMR